jgi:hypothetical protein
MNELFWRLAFRLYNRRKPSVTFEVITVGIGCLFALLYLISVCLSPLWTNGLRLLVAAVIVGVGIAHRSVRLEREKGPDALHRKMLSAKD